jgi:hypothetical protein
MKSRRFARIAAFGLAWAFAGCSDRDAAQVVLGPGGRVVVYEGLPHQTYERELLEEEKRTKATVTLHDFPFYREPLDLTEEGAKALRGLLGDARTFEPFAGEKTCGGFHPDYAVEWSHEGQTTQYQLCFGCGEVKVYGPGGEFRFDLRADARERLTRLLRPYRKNRPPFEDYGP